MPLAQYQPQVRFVLPAEQGGGTLSVDAEAIGHRFDRRRSATPRRPASTKRNGPSAAAARSSRAQFALNVDPREGNLDRLDSAELADRLHGIKYLYQQAQDVVYDSERLAGPNLGRFFMWLLIIVLLVEQVLAYSASYHPVRRGAAR